MFFKRYLFARSAESEQASSPPRSVESNSVPLCLRISDGVGNCLEWFRSKAFLCERLRQSSKLLGEITHVSDCLTKDQIRQAYEPAFKFLDSIPQIIADAKANDDSESLRRRCEKIEFEIQALKTLSDRLVERRAHLTSSLYSLDRLNRLQVITDMVIGSESSQRLRQSKHGSVEVVVFLGECLASWLRNLSFTRCPLHEESDDGTSFDEMLECLPANIPELWKQSRPCPPAEDQIAQCHSLLEEEKAILLVGLNDESKEHRGKRPSSDTNSDAAVTSPRNIATRSNAEIFLAALRDWHKFETDEFNYEPIDVDDLAALFMTPTPRRGFSRSSLYRMFDEIFDTYPQYKNHCRAQTIVQELKARSGEYSPHKLRANLNDEAIALVEQHRLGHDD